ncbi:hypothetical protein [Novosphingobium sp.]|uniref:hypothetical protein n=1 Tax=Novosphingobium sp. TaxID=1874826 RepID=UPI00286EA84D|nr:hypothetical protein [Novosphingobium sp.]
MSRQQEVSDEIPSRLELIATEMADLVSIRQQQVFARQALIANGAALPVDGGFTAG